MLAVGVSYRQTIRAYPHGGGSYIVATDNLGRMPGLIAAAGLMTDYILTVAVSVASGLEAVTSAIPSLAPTRRDRGRRDRRCCSPATCAACARPARCSPRRRTLFILAMFVLVVVGPDRRRRPRLSRRRPARR